MLSYVPTIWVDFIILSKVPKEVFASLKELAISKESQLFADQENVFEYFRN